MASRVPEWVPGSLSASAEHGTPFLGSQTLPANNKWSEQSFLPKEDGPNFAFIWCGESFSDFSRSACSYPHPCDILFLINKHRHSLMAKCTDAVIAVEKNVCGSLQSSLVNSLFLCKFTFHKGEPHGELPPAHVINMTLCILHNPFPTLNDSEVHTTYF